MAGAFQLKLQLLLDFLPWLRQCSFLWRGLLEDLNSQFPKISTFPAWEGNDFSGSFATERGKNDSDRLS